MRTEVVRKGIWIPPDIYQLKVTLLDTRPPIWRRLLVPSGFTLEDLHSVIQAAVGWHNSHLHEFRIGQERFGKPDRSDCFRGPSALHSERTAHLFRVLSKVGVKARYTYDFGDSWEHAIAMEKVLPPEAEIAYPVCIAGKLQGPPDDCGGIPGYYNLLEALHDPDHPEHEDLREWIGDEFDPEAFSVNEVNRRLAPIQRWWAKNRK